METHRLVVVRVISDNHKDELAFVTLAPGTLHEEKSFFATWHTRDKNFRRDILEKDLQAIYPFLNNNLWFAFDYESVAKTLQRLYGSINQSPPQSTGYIEASQLFGSTFSQSSNSLAYAAQFLHIAPWNTQNANAKTECDITWEILNRIALNLVVRRWTIPNQNTQSSPSDDQINAHETTAHDETSMTQPLQMDHSTDVSEHPHHHTHAHPHPHSHPHSHEETSYEAGDVNAPSTNEMTGRHHEFNPSANVDVQHPITDERNTMETGFEELGYQQHDTQLTDTNVQLEEEVNPNFSKEIEPDNKTSEEYVNSSSGAQPFSGHPSHSKDASYQSYDVNQTGDTHVHHSYPSSTNKKERKEESRGLEFASENTNSSQTGTRGATAESEQTTKRTGAPSQRVGSSWKDLAKGGQTTTSPSRTSQLHVVHGAINKKMGGGQGRFKPFQPTRDPKIIKQYVANAMGTNRVLWISYDGGKQPLAPRGVKPTQWDDHPGTELAFLGVPYHSKTGKVSKFFLRDVKEVRDRYWARPEDKNKLNQGYRGERNGQGGSKNEKKLSSNGTENANDNNNVEEINTTTNTDQARPKRKQRSRENKKSPNVGTVSEPTQPTQ